MLAAGKTVADQIYLHISALECQRDEMRSIAATAASVAGVSPGNDFNVIRLAQDGTTASLLDYPEFLSDAFPSLRRTWSVDLRRRVVRFRTYEASLNPPVLHRKELLLPPDHPESVRFSDLTRSAEELGLFDQPSRIGFKLAWQALLNQRGYKIVDHQLVPIGNDESVAPSQEDGVSLGVARHLTALTRYSFSAPVQTLARFGFLDKTRTFFDYGCGKGDDVRGLTQNGIIASGWDPHFAPDSLRVEADIVNLGFVINVIEDPTERAEAMRDAYSLAKEMLVVSAMLSSQEGVNGVPFGDGVLTARNTFQKYYTQAGLREFISQTIGVEPIPVGPGTFYVFKSKDVEQRFEYGRLENRRNVLLIKSLSRPDPASARERPKRISASDAKYAQHAELLDTLWTQYLRFGRELDAEEVERSAEIVEAFGSIRSAQRFLRARKEQADTMLEEAARSRQDDLRVYFARLQFERRPRYRQLEARLQRDVKAFFGNYSAALDSGKQLVFELADVAVINKECQRAAERGLGWFQESESLQLHTSLVPQLPPSLRAYISCGTYVFGDVSSADLIKIHIRSGKLTLMRFDDFAGKPLPRMVQRVKINFRTQELDIFDYGEMYPSPYLYRKSRYVNEEFPKYWEQLSFEGDLQRLGMLQFDGHGPSATEFDAMLEKKRLSVEGFLVIRSRSIPDLDAACGRFFSYRKLIECGDTFLKVRPDNAPKQSETYDALLDLAVNVLDRVIDYFGMVELTYGFASRTLTKYVGGRISPALDQHASCERKRSGAQICERGGAACDFLVRDEDMLEVALWVAANTPFDRLYYYGPNRPIHVSYGPSHSRQFVEMTEAPGKVVVPKVRADIHRYPSSGSSSPPTAAAAPRESPPPR